MQTHTAQIVGGHVSWKPFVADVAVQPGTIVMFRADDATRRRKFIDLSFSFPSGQGYDLAAQARKTLFNDDGFDAAADLSTAQLSLSAAGREVARGTISVHPREFVRQLDELVVTGAHRADEEQAAKDAFIAFMNHELGELYPGMPLVQEEPGHLTPDEKRTLELCIRCLLPDPLPPGGAQMNDIIDSLESTLAQSESAELSTIRGYIRTAGLIVPIIGKDVNAVRRFIADSLRSSALTPVRDVMSMLHSLVVFPYWAHSKTDGLSGYRRPVHKPHGAAKLPVMPEPPDQEFDVVIAGSGPAGTLLAARLAAADRSVLLLEAGPYIPEKEMGPDELESIAKLYKEAGLQRANQPESIFDQPGPSFFVLQGQCVGGGGIVNNAVCFQLPAHKLLQWQAVGFPIAEVDLRSAYRRVAMELPIIPIGESTPLLNPAGPFLEKQFGPIRKPSVEDPPETGLFECLVNLERRTSADDSTGCIGSGLCNVGCGSERKRNGVQVYLPTAVANGCVIVPDARVTEVKLAAAVPGGPRRATGVVARLRDGRTVTVRARQVILAAGPIGSTEILLRSRDLEDPIRTLRLPVGSRFSANIGSPLFAFMPNAVELPPGVQIAHYYMPPGADDGFVVETWYNPPGANALATPGYMQEHFDRMKQYTSTIAAAPLVGTRARGQVKLQNGRVAVRLPVDGREVERVAAGLCTLGKAFLKGGARSVLAGFEGGRTLKNEADADKLQKDLVAVANNRDRLHQLQVGTGHPQGGNPMSDDPRIGVLDAAFRVRGIDNLRVCNGSIFPDSAGVNPQWTIMALADCCAQAVLRS